MKNEDFSRKFLLLEMYISREFLSDIWDHERTYSLGTRSKSGTNPFTSIHNHF
jgi:hypothetical protein